MGGTLPFVFENPFDAEGEVRKALFVVSMAAGTGVSSRGGGEEGGRVSGWSVGGQTVSLRTMLDRCASSLRWLT